MTDAHGVDPVQEIGWFPTVKSGGSQKGNFAFSQKADLQSQGILAWKAIPLGSCVSCQGCINQLGSRRDLWPFQEPKRNPAPYELLVGIDPPS